MDVVSPQNWFASRSHDHGVTQYWEPYVDPVFQANFWLVDGGEQSMLIDSGNGFCALREGVPELDTDDLVVVATHAHIDHIGGFHEWDTRVAHRAEADDFARGPAPMSLRTAEWPAEYVQALAEEGYVLGDVLIEALPRDDFDLSKHVVPPAAVTRFVEDGEMLQVGDREFEILHLPGHSPGGIGLFERETGILFAGDAVYDGPLLDKLTGSNIDDYVVTMKRLRKLPVSVVHAGHDASFGRARLTRLCDRYIRSREGVPWID